MPVRIMSDAELTKFETLRDVDQGRMPARAAAVLGLGERQVWRLLKANRARGADGLISKKRGRPESREAWLRRAILDEPLWMNEGEPLERMPLPLVRTMHMDAAASAGDQWPLLVHSGLWLGPR